MKSTTAERIEQVGAWYLGGAAPHAIEDRGAATWGVTRRRVRAYLARAQRPEAVDPRVLALAHRARVEELILRTYQAAKAVGDARAMVAAAVQLGELDGVLGRHRLEVGVSAAVGLAGVAVMTATTMEGAP